MKTFVLGFVAASGLAAALVAQGKVTPLKDEAASRAYLARPAR